MPAATRRPAIEMLEQRQLLASTVELVKDIASGSGSSSPQALVDWSGQLGFATLNGGTSRLWTTAGTGATTALVGNIGHFSTTGWQSKPTKPRVAGGRLFFTAWHPTTTDYVLWTADTPATAPHVIDVPGLTATEFVGTRRRPIAFGDRLLFEGTTDTSDHEPWITDGTPAGTRRLLDVRPGLAGGGMQDPTLMGGHAYFLSDDGTGYGVWKTDGTAAGTSRVAPMAFSGDWAMDDALAAVDGQLFFVSNRRELWRTDGTPQGTQRLRTFDTPSSGGNAIAGDLVAWNGKLYFSANETATGFELWSSDGTAAGTQRVADVNPGPTGSAVRRMAVVGSRLFLLAHTAATGYEWWSTDGTAGGTSMMADLVPGSAGITNQANFWEMPEVVTAGGRFYFTQFPQNGSPVTVLWQSDGTAAGTSRLPLPAGASLIDANELVLSGTNLYFSGTATGWPGLGGTSGSTGWELFRYPLPADESLPAWVAPGGAATWDAATRTLGVSGAVTLTGSPGSDVTLTAAGPGAAVTVAPAGGAAQVQLGALNLAGGARLTLAPNFGGGAPRVLVLAGNPSIDATSTLDLADNAMVIRGGTRAAVRALLTRGFDGGDWRGTGLTSGAAAADATGASALGYATAGQLGVADFLGVSGLAAGDVLVRHTYYGDTNLDRLVNTDDVINILAAGKLDSGLPADWFEGDMTFDGLATTDDVIQILSAGRLDG